jgi:[acyl-carrier-protein] S-malonyltransferase
MAAGLEGTGVGARLLRAAAASGFDLAEALGRDDQGLTPTEVAQPALAFTELVLASALPSDVEVVAVAGHSVGELAACATAGALSPEAAIGLAVERGRLMAAMREGTMAAVLGLDADAVERICADVEGTVVVANLNGPGQVVISGAVAAVAAASRMATDAGARRVLPLKVSGAFHSPLMAGAAEAYARVLEAVPMADAHIPVVLNVDAAAVREAGEIRSRMRRQMVSPVRWTESVQRLVGLGAEVLVEVGPGSVLSGLARRIAPEIPALSVASLSAAAGLADRLAG